MEDKAIPGQIELVFPKLEYAIHDVGSHRSASTEDR